MAQSSLLSSAHELSVSALQNILIAKINSDFNGDNAISLTSGGSINGRDDARVHLVANQADTKTYLNAATGIGDPLVMELPWVEAVTSDGDINIISNNDLYASLISAENGKVTLATIGDLTVEEISGDSWIYVDGYLAAGDMSYSEGTLVARDGVSVEHVDLHGKVEITVQAPSIEMNIDLTEGNEAKLSLLGYQGQSSEAIDIDVSAELTTFTLLSADNGQVAVSGDMNIEHCLIEHKMDILTEKMSLLINNDDPSAVDVSAQMMTPYGEFWLESDRYKLNTNVDVRYLEQDIQIYN